MNGKAKKSHGTQTHKDMKLEVVNIQGQKTGREVDLPEDIFGIEPNDHAVYLAVKQYLANQRQGTHKAKERGEVAGSTRKLKRQKGTGTARFGDIKNPLFRGGGRVFGPRPRNYGIKLNKTYAQGADGRLGNDHVEVKTITPFKTKDVVVVDTAGNFNKLLVVKINEDFQVSGRMIDRKDLPKRQGRYLRVRWSDLPSAS